jgi:ketosteroid isomerase-like protein
MLPGAARTARRRARPIRTSPTGRGVATITRWALDASDGYPSPAGAADPWARLVREAIELYRIGQSDNARRLWSDDVVWRIWGSPATELRGADAIFDYHARIDRLTAGTFRQQLLAVEGSGGPVVTAYLHTRAERGAAVLDLPSLVTFEVARMRICRIVEVPGDPAAWDAFWAS